MVKIWHLETFEEVFFNTGLNGTGKFQNATTVFIRSQENARRTLLTIAEYRLLLFLAIDQVF